MKTTVVCGLLGSGKTTFIKNFIRGITEKAVVLVNDFGQAGIDGEIFSAGGVESVELPSGCVCCTLRFDLITTVRRIVEQFSPDHLLIEPSGVASPSGVIEALDSAGAGMASVVGIVDAVEFAELYGSGMYGGFLEDQIVNSDVVLVNKTDIAGREAIAAAERLIGEINPRAVLFRTVNAELRDELLPSSGKKVGAKGSGKESGKKDISLQNEHCRFETHSFKLPQETSLESIRRMIEELAWGKYGSVVRAKALVATDKGPFRFDVAYRKIDVAPFEKEITESRLVVIGESMDAEGIRKGLVEITA